MKLPLSLGPWALGSLLAAAHVSPHAWAQAGDSCAAPITILGEGLFPFDTSAMTTDGVPDTACLAFGTAQIERDMWLLWTATVDGLAEVSTCGGAAFDTRLAAYPPFPCGAAALACNDDGCGVQSSLTFAVEAGQDYLLRLGSYPGTPGGPGVLAITIQAPVVDAATGHAYLVIPKKLDWYTAKAAAEALVFQGQAGHLATIGSQAERDFIISSLSFGRVWIGLEQDTSSSIYTEPAGAWGWVTGEIFSYTSWRAGEPNDTPAGENHGEMFADGTWNDAEFFSGTAEAYLVEFEPGATLFCTPASPGSVGTPVTLADSGPGGGVLHLEATGGPPGEFGIFLVAAQSSAPVTISAGDLCLAPPLGRYAAAAGPGLNSIGQFDGGGRLANFAGTSSVGTGFDVPAVLPAPPGGLILPGSTWCFQLWYRDAGGVSNFSDGLAVSF
ncbi:MAG: C-type lectin domain-containing protein [Planctomycetes bacterium]|nr:C-type lectin domain-containing protein [Planctomycetota bacterium]